MSGEQSADTVASTEEEPVIAKKTKQDLTCEDCGVVFNSTLYALRHFKGKRHGGGGKEAEVDDAKCDDCGVVFTSPFYAQRHFRGLRHKSKMNVEFDKDLHSKCDDCGVTCKSLVEALSHFKGKRHRSTVLENRARGFPSQRGTPQGRPGNGGSARGLGRGRGRGNPKYDSTLNDDAIKGQNERRKRRWQQEDDDQGSIGLLPSVSDLKQPLTKKPKQEDAGQRDAEEKVEVEKELQCDVCSFVFNSATSALAHFQSKMHETKRKAKFNKDFDLKCDDCGVLFHSVLETVQHFKGRRHFNKITSMASANLESEGGEGGLVTAGSRTQQRGAPKGRPGYSRSGHGLRQRGGGGNRIRSVLPDDRIGNLRHTGGTSDYIVSKGKQGARKDRPGRGRSGYGLGSQGRVNPISASSQEDTYSRMHEFSSTTGGVENNALASASPQQSAQKDLPGRGRNGYDLGSQARGNPTSAPSREDLYARIGEFLAVSGGMENEILSSASTQRGAPKGRPGRRRSGYGLGSRGRGNPVSAPSQEDLYERINEFLAVTGGMTNNTVLSAGINSNSVGGFAAKRGIQRGSPKGRPGNGRSGYGVGSQGRRNPVSTPSREDGIQRVSPKGRPGNGRSGYGVGSRGRRNPVSTPSREDGIQRGSPKGRLGNGRSGYGVGSRGRGNPVNSPSQEDVYKRIGNFISSGGMRNRTLASPIYGGGGEQPKQSVAEQPRQLQSGYFNESLPAQQSPHVDPTHLMGDFNHSHFNNNYQMNVATDNMYGSY